MTPDLTTLSDAQLSEVFAVECAGCKFAPMFAEYGPDDKHVWFDDEGNWITDPEGTLCAPWFATSADAVMPFLAVCRVTAERVLGEEGFPDAWKILVDTGAPNGIGETAHESFARAACIALILAGRSAKGRA